MFGSSKFQSNWNPSFFEQGGLFDLFRPWAAWFLRYSDAFPSLEDVNDLMREGRVAPACSGGGFPLKCIKQQRIGRAMRDALGWQADYQLRIFFSGEMPTRLNNWHDFFNAWSWIHFPKTKAVINQRHFTAHEENLVFPWRRCSGNRNREQDFLTLFDEGGLLVVTSDDRLWESIQKRRWIELFCEQKESLYQRAAFLPFGHALYECALAEHPRIHASAVRVDFDITRFKNSTGEIDLKILACIDEAAALVLSRRGLFSTPDDLYALPIWGLPGWHPLGGQKEFIADTTYFR